MTAQNIVAELVDVEKIKQILPHRYPFLLVDRVISYEAGKSIKTLKNITINEPFFQGHFEYHAVMPGVLIIEAFAQSSALLGSLTASSTGEKFPENASYYLVGIDNARFRQIVTPGDQLIIDSKVIVYKRGIWKFDSTAKVSDKLVASAEVLTTIVD